ncbi:hypothetical protein OG800_44970 [Streptomyces sp. NBC_00445]|uniref:Rv1733c family protein n=1 Tax=unclassified Streptomyces TaxID=2593676 RepID=UPI002E1F7872|nr:MULTISPECIES: hypothetical protein [unclassified Streptomyces]
MRTRVRGWRWRPSPLRRRSDIVEAWTVVVVAVLLFVGAPLAGAAAAWWAHGEARDTAAAQRAERRQVRAEVVGAVSGSLPTAQGGRTHTRQVTVRWTEPGQGERTARALVPPGSRPGQTVHVWFDSRGRSVAPPPDGFAVWQHTLAMGLCAAGGAVGVVFLAHGVVRHVAMHHRLAEWEREWARTEPEWTRRWA